MHKAKNLNCHRCKYCKSSFDERKWLYEHNLQHLQLKVSKVEVAKCGACNFCFSTRASLIEHAAKVHRINIYASEKPGDACSVCKQSPTMVRQRASNGLLKSIISCSNCQSIFYSELPLNESQFVNMKVENNRNQRNSLRVAIILNEAKEKANKNSKKKDINVMVKQNNVLETKNKRFVTEGVGKNCKISRKKCHKNVKQNSQLIPRKLSVNTKIDEQLKKPVFEHKTATSKEKKPCYQDKFIDSLNQKCIKEEEIDIKIDELNLTTEELQSNVPGFVSSATFNPVCEENVNTEILYNSNLDDLDLPVEMIDELLSMKLPGLATDSGIRSKIFFEDSDDDLSEEILGSSNTYKDRPPDLMSKTNILETNVINSSSGSFNLEGFESTNPSGLSVPVLLTTENINAKNQGNVGVIVNSSLSSVPCINILENNPNLTLLESKFTPIHMPNDTLVSELVNQNSVTEQQLTVDSIIDSDVQDILIEKGITIDDPEYIIPNSDFDDDNLRLMPPDVTENINTSDVSPSSLSLSKSNQLMKSHVPLLKTNAACSHNKHGYPYNLKAFNEKSLNEQCGCERDSSPSFTDKIGNSIESKIAVVLSNSTIENEDQANTHIHSLLETPSVPEVEVGEIEPETVASNAIIEDEETRLLLKSVNSSIRNEKNRLSLATSNLGQLDFNESGSMNTSSIENEEINRNKNSGNSIATFDAHQDNPDLSKFPFIRVRGSNEINDNIAIFIDNNKNASIRCRDNGFDIGLIGNQFQKLNSTSNGNIGAIQFKNDINLKSEIIMMDSDDEAIENLDDISTLYAHNQDNSENVEDPLSQSNISFNGNRFDESCLKTSIPLNEMIKMRLKITHFQFCMVCIALKNVADGINKYFGHAKSSYPIFSCCACNETHDFIIVIIANNDAQSRLQSRASLLVQSSEKICINGCSDCNNDNHDNVITIYFCADCAQGNNFSTFASIDSVRVKWSCYRCQKITNNIKMFVIPLPIAQTESVANCQLESILNPMNSNPTIAEENDAKIGCIDSVQTIHSIDLTANIDENRKHKASSSNEDSISFKDPLVLASGMQTKSVNIPSKSVKLKKFVYCCYLCRNKYIKSCKYTPIGMNDKVNKHRCDVCGKKAKNLFSFFRQSDQDAKCSTDLKKVKLDRVLKRIKGLR